MRLAREVRIWSDEDPDASPSNSWAGGLRGGQVGAFWRIRAVVSGAVNPTTGYLCNIQLIDRAIRSQVVPALRESAGRARTTLPDLAAALGDATRRGVVVGNGVVLERVELHLSPHTSLSVDRREGWMTSLTQSYEFSASHRLYSPALSEADNGRVFGKCANPNGHGHNYVLEVTVVGAADGSTGVVTALPRLDAEVRKRVIDRFDHKHLNLDCPEFAELNPTVENIARVIWRLLDGAVEGGRVSNVRVWETPKTYADFDGRP